ncbi:hypothetical protein [Oscillatoria salina]|uniref:hypothetical protein n=1 Tax=Oscillatoria salina TaxID=331517 RepID=UPI0013BCE04F|nr:hypothetical protein [Oscillatoria salina]MBZ8178847.1 hypothetical protein [Oscillatoria salina IIICB1]NET87620.1 hypothetical protein [Kamptonema sp. SIO1D9]
MKLLERQTLTLNFVSLFLLLLLNISPSFAHNGERHTLPESSSESTSPSRTIDDEDSEVMNHDESAAEMGEMKSKEISEVIVSQNQSFIPSGLGELILFLIVMTPIGLFWSRR